ncbi:hypothetical protein IAT38_003812 [Cryptococcus sp. DSM 104549]
MPPQRTAKKHANTGPIASSSKATLDIPPVDIPETLTPGYAYAPTVRRPLTEQERRRLVHELVGFNPRILCDDITEAARVEVNNAVNSIENWAVAVSKDPQSESELSMGLHALETLLESRVDQAMDRLQSWTLRNAFEFEPHLEVVLPWHRGLDFSRGEFVVTQMKGQEGVEQSIEELRSKVEQARFLSQRLETAEKELDRRLEAAKQRKGEVGFVKEIIDSAGLSPLPTRAAQIQSTLTSLQSALAPLDIIPLPTTAPPPTAGEHTKAWELGRAAYLNWALGKMVPGESAAGAVAGPSGAGAGDGEAKLEAIEKGIEEVGPKEGVEILGNSLGQ